MIQAKLYFSESSGSGGVKIPVGIHDKGTVMFNGLVKDQDWYDILFNNTSGQSIHTRLFAPTGNRPKEGESPVDALKRETDARVDRVVSVLRVLLGDQVTEMLEAPDYSSFMERASLMLTPMKGTKVNLKVVPDYREGKYPDLPMFNFFEKWEEGKPTSLSFTPAQRAAVEKHLSGGNASDNSAKPGSASVGDVV